MEKGNEFKASSVEAAIEKGLKKLGLKEEDADIEVVSKESGLFSKAVVKITPKSNVNVDVVDEVESAEAEESKDVEIENAENADNEEESAENEAENENSEVKGENDGAGRDNYRREQRNDRRRNDRRPRERREYFTEEKAIGKDYIATIAKYINDKARVDAKASEDELCFYIGGEDANVFIGHRGETLDAIQYLAGQVINKGKKEEEHIRVTVDADFYRERRKRTLTGLARKLAAEAYAKKTEISLEPMNSYERRIIHSALQNSMEATTRSEGEGKYRHVVIVPKCEVMSYGNVSAEFRKKGPGKTKSFGQKRMKF